MDSFMYLIQLIEESWLIFDTTREDDVSKPPRQNCRLCVNPERALRITEYSRQLGKRYYSPYYLSWDVNNALTALAEDNDLRIPPNALAPTLAKHLLPNGLDGVALLKLCTVEHGIRCTQTESNRYTVTAQISLARGIPFLFELVAHMILVTRRTLEKTCCDFTAACALVDANATPAISAPIDEAQPFITREFLVESSHEVRTNKGKTLHEALESLSDLETTGYASKELEDMARKSSIAEAPKPPIETSQIAERDSFETALTEKILEQLRQHPNNGASIPALYNQLSSFFSQRIASCIESLQKDGLVAKKDSLHYIAIDADTRSAGGNANMQATNDMVQSLGAKPAAKQAATPATLHAAHKDHLETSTSSSLQQTTQVAQKSSSTRSTAETRTKEPHEHTARILAEFAPLEFNTKAGAVYFLTLLGVTAPDICEILKINQSQYHLLREDGFEMSSHPLSYDERCRKDVGLCNHLNNLRQSDKRLLIQFFTHKIAYNPGCNRSMEECQQIEALDRIFDALGLYSDKQATETTPRHNAAPDNNSQIVNAGSEGVVTNSSNMRQMLPSHPDYPMASLDEPACPSDGVALPLCFWPYPFKRLDHRLLFCHLLGGGKYKISKAFGITAQKYETLLEKACFSTPLVENATYRTKRYYYRVNSARINLGRAQHDGDPMAFATSLPKSVKDYLLCWLLGDNESQIAEYMEVSVSDIPTYRLQLARYQIAWANGSARHIEKPVTQATGHTDYQAREKAAAPLNTPSRTIRAANVAAPHPHKQPHRAARRVSPGHLPPTANPFPSLAEYPMASADQQQEPMTGQAIPLEYWPYPFAEQSDQAFFLLLLGGNNGEISRMLNVTWHAADRLTENARLRHSTFANAITQHSAGHVSIDMKQLDLTALRANHDPLGFIASLMTPQRQFLLHWIMGEDDNTIAKTLNINVNRIPAFHLAIVRAQNDWVIERKTNAGAHPAPHAETRNDRQPSATKQAAPTTPFSAGSAPTLKQTAAPNAAVPSYIPRTVQTPLFQIGVSDKPKETTYQEPIQDQLFASGPIQASLFDQREASSQNLPVSHSAAIATPITYSEWLRTLDDFTASVVSAKIEEGTYASVAQKAHVTHRQCRLAYDEAMRNMPRLEEQQYLYLMETYVVDEPRFTRLTGLTNGSYRYLCHIRQQRGVRALDQYGPDDPKLPISLRGKLKGKDEDQPSPASNPLNLVHVGDSYVRKSFRHVATELGKQLTATKAVTIGQFQREYQRVLSENHLATQALLSHPDNSQAFMQALGKTNSFLTPTKDSIRYYNFAAHDLSLIASMLRKEAQRNIECSTALLFDEHRALMDRLDIHNPNELHAVIKRVVHDYRLHAVAINKIPLITLGTAQRRDQVLAIIKELSPCSGDEIAIEYQERYGVNVNTVKSSYLRDFQAYRKDGRYEYRDTKLTDQQLESLRGLLVNDCHALSSI